MKFAVFLSLALSIAVGTNAQRRIEIFERYFLPDRQADYLEMSFEWNQPGKVQAFFNDGLTELSEGRYMRALKGFKGAVAEAPTFVPALYYRAITYKLLDSISKAENDFLRAARLAPTEPLIQLELGKFYLLHYNTLKALEYFERSVELKPDFVEGHFYLGNTYWKLDNSRKAIKSYERCNEIDPSYPKAFVKQALLVYDRSAGRKNDDAAELLDRAIKADSTYQPALFWRGVLDLDKGDTKRVLTNWNKLVAYNPDNRMLLMMRAYLLMDLGDFENAYIDLRKMASAIQTDENLFSASQSTLDQQIDLQFATAYISRVAYGLDEPALAHLKRGYCFLFAKDKARAISAFKASSRAQPSGVAHFLTAMTYEHTGGHDSAFYFYDAALRLDNEIFDAHKKRGIYRSELKDWKGAFADFVEMERIEPSLKVTYRLRANVRTHFRDYYGCIIDMTKYLSFDTLELEALTTRAICRYAVKDFAGSADDYRKAIALQPDKYDLYESLVQSVLAAGDSSQALKEIDDCERARGIGGYLKITKIRLLIERGENAMARLVLDKVVQEMASWFPTPSDYEMAQYTFLDGLIDYHTGHYKDSLKKFNKAIKLSKDQFESIFYRAKVHIAIGKRAEAIKDLKTLAEKDFPKAKELLAHLQNSQNAASR